MNSLELKQRASMITELPKHAEVVIFCDEGYNLPEAIIKLKKCHIVPLDQVGYEGFKCAHGEGGKR